MRIQDLTAKIPIEVYRINWSWGKKTEGWLRRQCVGFTVHVCPGRSKVGDLRIDIDPQTRPDIIADLHHLPLRPGCCKTLVIDPPFSNYNRFKWINILSNYTTHRLIISAPGGILPRLKGWKIDYFAIIQRGTMFVRYFCRYTKKNQNLENFK